MKQDEQTRFKNLVQKTMNELDKAYCDSNFLEAAKKIGILEYLGFPDIEYLTGMAYKATGDIKGEINHFSLVDESSVHYPSALENLAGDFCVIGDYPKLDEVLSKAAFPCTPLEEFHLRITCLTNANAHFFETNEGTLKEIHTREILSIGHSDVEAEFVFDLCCKFAAALVAAGACLYKCAITLDISGDDGDDIENNADLKVCVDQYKKWCTILHCSKLFPPIQLPQGFSSLADAALYRYEWKDKIKAFSTVKYRDDIIRTIQQLCRPETHPQVPEIRAVMTLLDLIGRICPEATASIIDFYFDTIAKAYSEGDYGTAQYIGYAYSEIIATGTDPLNLKSRIEAIQKDNQYDYDETASQIKMVRKLSRRGYEALQTAQRSFDRIKKGTPGVEDYSALSLQFFRILEIEYCEKLICPVAKEVDVSHLNELVEQIEPADPNNKNEKKEADWKKQGWKKDKNCLKRIRNGQQSSIELGVVRTFLLHLVDWKTREDPCAKYLYPFVEKHLTEEGIQALQDQTMLDVLSRENLENYRVPGAHTGYLPYSKACEGVEYVQKNLPAVVSWFK